MISKDKNKEFFKLLEDVNVFSHAYLFETNSIKDAYPFILMFAKKILCDNHYINQDKQMIYEPTRYTTIKEVFIKSTDKYQDKEFILEKFNKKGDFENSV